MADGRGAGSRWTYEEVLASVEGYIRIRAAQQAGTPVVKAEVSRELRRGALATRSKQSVEFRMRNISSVFDDLGLDFVEGYLPAANVGAGVKAMIRKALAEVSPNLKREASAASPDRNTLHARASLLRVGGLREPPGNPTPARTSQTSAIFVRDPRVVAFVLDAAAGTCELCGQAAPFTRDGGEPFLEVHHVRSLSAGGPDTVANAAALCPNCHRRCHFSDDSGSATKALIRNVDRLTEC